MCVLVSGFMEIFLLLKLFFVFMLKFEIHKTLQREQSFEICGQ